MKQLFKVLLCIGLVCSMLLCAGCVPFLYRLREQDAGTNAGGWQDLGQRTSDEFQGSYGDYGQDAEVDADTGSWFDGQRHGDGTLFIWDCSIYVAPGNGEEFYFESAAFLNERYIRTAYLQNGVCQYALHEPVDAAVLRPLELFLTDYRVDQWEDSDGWMDAKVYVSVDTGSDYFSESRVPAQYSGFATDLTSLLKRMSQPYRDSLPQAAQVSPAKLEIAEARFAVGAVQVEVSGRDGGAHCTERMGKAALERDLKSGEWNKVVSMCKGYDPGDNMETAVKIWKWGTLELTDAQGAEYLYYVPEDFLKGLGTELDDQARSGAGWRGAENARLVEYFYMKDQQGKEISSIVMASSTTKLPEMLYREFGEKDRPASVWYQYHDGKFKGMTGELLWDSEIQLFSMMVEEYGVAGIPGEPGAQDRYDRDAKGVPDDYEYYYVGIRYADGTKVETQFSQTNREFLEFRELMHQTYGYLL